MFEDENYIYGYGCAPKDWAKNFPNVTVPVEPEAKPLTTAKKLQIDAENLHGRLALEFRDRYVDLLNKNYAELVYEVARGELCNDRELRLLAKATQSVAEAMILLGKLADS